MESDTNNMGHLETDKDFQDEFQDALELELAQIDKAVQRQFGITLEELGPPGSIEREQFMERFRAEEANNQRGEN